MQVVFPSSGELEKRMEPDIDFSCFRQAWNYGHLDRNHKVMAHSTASIICQSSLRLDCL